MTRRIEDGERDVVREMLEDMGVDSSTIIVLEGQPDGTCELCGKTAELRPYGPRGENVCFKCGMKDEEAAKRQFNRIVLGERIS